MKTIYIQMVFSFLIAVIVSLFAGFVLSSQLYKSQLLDFIETNMLKTGREIIQLYQSSSSENLDEYLTSVSSLNYQIILYNEQAEKKEYGSSEEGWNLDSEQVKKVLRGGVYHGISQFEDPTKVGVGLPFKVDDDRYALFLRPDLEDHFAQFRRLILTVLGVVLLLGSIIFVIMTKFIVKPIQQLTSATKELSKGNFQTQVKTNRRDELGNLAISFNEMAKDLGQLEAMRQQFVSNVSHEIQSPLTSIRGFARALKDNVVKDEKEREKYLSIIETESKRLSIMSQNLLRLATLDSDQPPHHPMSYRLDEQIRRVVVSHEPQWAEKEQEVEVNLTKSTIYADEAQMEQVWTNLLTNSIRYTPNHGKITISLTRSEKVTTVTIDDNGIGISEENQKRIFERFYKVDTSRTRSEGGNGLGLAIVQRIVILHGGNIIVESVEGEGSRFSVRIPQNQII